MYIHRAIQNSIKVLEKMYKAILITDPRQSGKTTFLSNYKPNIPLLNFDDPALRENIIHEPNIFFKQHSFPLILDEIQKVPEIFLPLKSQVDKNAKKAQCYLSGSQSFLLMKNVSESLAGRLGIINLLGLSQKEKPNIDFNVEFYPDDKYLNSAKNTKLSYNDIWHEILMGALLNFLSIQIIIKKYFGKTI